VITGGNVKLKIPGSVILVLFALFKLKTSLDPRWLHCNQAVAEQAQ
jgi:hypothetical protein